MIDRDRPALVDISVVLPVYNEQGGLEKLHERLTAVLGSMSCTYEMVFVNDGSRDRSWQVILRLAERDPSVRAVSLSRNFGHQVAITAGLDASGGRAVVVMDSDHQDPPELIPSLYEKFLAGFDVVYAQRRSREGETWWKKTTAKVFYRLIRRMTTLEIPVDTGDFRLMSKRVADDLRRLQEHSRFIRGLVTWVGYNQVAVQYDRDARYGGETNFSTGRMLKFAFDGITSFSSQPLRFASNAGLLLAALSLALMLFFMAYKLLGGQGLIQGWTSLIVTVLLLGGLQLLSVGILGEYIGRIYEEVKHRPMYLIQDHVNLSERPSQESSAPVVVSREAGAK